MEDYLSQEHGIPPGTLPFGLGKLQSLLRNFHQANATDSIVAHLKGPINIAWGFDLPTSPDTPYWMEPEEELPAAEMQPVFDEMQDLFTSAASQGIELAEMFPAMWAAHLTAFKLSDIMSLHQIHADWNLSLQKLEDPPDPAPECPNWGNQRPT